MKQKMQRVDRSFAPALSLPALILRSLLLLGFVLPSFVLVAPARAADLTLRSDPTQTTADFTLADTLHTVHGSFQGKRGELHFDPASGKISGDLIFDATSGHTDSTTRDKKMHKEIIESWKYAEISFRPDRVDGKVSVLGTSTIQVHGIFGIHGAEHEITTPVTVRFEGDHWEVTAHFPVPYVAWGMKNPSILFLRVGDNVDIDLKAKGSIGIP